MPGIFNEAAYQAAVSLALAPHVERGGEWLKEALSHEGTGVLYPHNPFRSSTPDEYPAPQTEALAESIGIVMEDYRTFGVGSFSEINAEGYRHALELESAPPSQGGRYFLEQALVDSDLHAAILEP